MYQPVRGTHSHKGRRYSEGKDCFSQLPLPLAFNMHHYFGQKRLLGVGNKEEEERHQYHERKTDPSPQTISLAPAFLARPHSGIGGPGPGGGATSQLLARAPSLL